MKLDPDKLPLPKEPYRGVLSFRLLDWRIFFERERDAERLANLVSMYASVLLYGQSGTGKSSLLNAGLLPDALRRGRAPERIRVFPEPDRAVQIERIRLREEDDANFTSGNESLNFLPSRFTSEDNDDRVPVSCERFLEILRAPSDLGLPLLIFDQFEEYVTLFEETSTDQNRFNAAQEAHRAIENLIRELLLNDPLPLRVVFAFRDDYLARLAPLFWRIPNLMDHGLRLSLPMMDHDLFHHIVRGPFLPSDERGLKADQFGEGLGEEVAQRVEEGIRVSQPSGVLNLSELQTLCRALWSEPKRRMELLRTKNTPAVLRRIIRSEAMTSLKKKFWRLNRIRAIAVLSNLVTEDGTRNVVAHQMLVSQTRRNPMLWVFRGKWRKFLERLSETGLVRRSLTSGTTFHYELTSEFLIPQIQRWQQRFRMQRQIIVAFICAVLIAVPWVEYVRATNAERAAKVASEIARTEKDNAEKAERRAIQQSKIARTESFRVRKQNFESQNSIIAMADRLLELATPQEAPIWHIWKMGALEMLGRNDDTILECNAILERDSENYIALDHLSYAYNAQHAPGAGEKALAASNRALQKGYDNWETYQYRANTLALLGRYKKAEEAFRKSNEKFTASGEDVVETQVSPDIVDSIRRKVLVVTDLASHGANYYGIANLRAYDGDPTFPQALEEVPKRPSLGDAALVALNWAWMHMQARPQDYGALIAQAALWEQAQLPALAKKYYLEFERVHRKKADPRYDRLTDWVGKRLKELQAVREPAADESDAQTLQLEAMELLDVKDYSGALERIEAALRLDPNDASLLLLRRSIKVQKDPVTSKQDWEASNKIATQS